MSCASFRLGRLSSLRGASATKQSRQHTGASLVRNRVSQRSAALLFCFGVGTAGPFSVSPYGEWSAGKRLEACEASHGAILGVRVPPLAVAARRQDGIASSVRRRALGNPVRVRAGRKGEEAPPGAPPRRQACAACGGNHSGRCRTAAPARTSRRVMSGVRGLQRNVGRKA